ncbi:hypothetical protein AAC387_Pa01g4025 [Persea americana]
MCPLRLILIFLSATFAGILVLKGLKSKPESQNPDDTLQDKSETDKSVPISSKVFSTIASGFWTCVDMASGRYLWRNLHSMSSSKQR